MYQRKSFIERWQRFNDEGHSDYFSKMLPYCRALAKRLADDCEPAESGLVAALAAAEAKPYVCVTAEKVTATEAGVFQLWSMMPEVSLKYPGYVKMLLDFPLHPTSPVLHLAATHADYRRHHFYVFLDGSVLTRDCGHSVPVYANGLRLLGDLSPKNYGIGERSDKWVRWEATRFERGGLLFQHAIVRWLAPCFGASLDSINRDSKPCLDTPWLVLANLLLDTALVESESGDPDETEAELRTLHALIRAHAGIADVRQV